MDWGLQGLIQMFGCFGKLAGELRVQAIVQLAKAVMFVFPCLEGHELVTSGVCRRLSEIIGQCLERGLGAHHRSLNHWNGPFWGETTFSIFFYKAYSNFPRPAN